MTIVNLNVRDCGNKPFANDTIYFATINPPVSTGSFLSVGHTQQDSTDATGSLTIQTFVPAIYLGTVVTEEPNTNFYLQVTTGSYSIVSASYTTGTAPQVYADFIELLGNSFVSNSVVVTPTDTYPRVYNNNLILLSSTQSITDGNGYVSFDQLIPQMYKVETYGTDIDPFYISVPNSGSSWNMKDLIVNAPSSSIVVTLNGLDKSYVLSVSSSDARYLSQTGTTLSSSYAVTASFALNGGGSGGTTLTTGSTYPITSSFSVSSSFARSASSASLAQSAVSASFAVVARTVNNASGEDMDIQYNNQGAMFGTSSLQWDDVNNAFYIGDQNDPSNNVSILSNGQIVTPHMVLGSTGDAAFADSKVVIANTGHINCQALNVQTDLNANGTITSDQISCNGITSSLLGTASIAANDATNAKLALSNNFTKNQVITSSTLPVITLVGDVSSAYPSLGDVLRIYNSGSANHVGTFPSTLMASLGGFFNVTNSFHSYLDLKSVGNGQLGDIYFSNSGIALVNLHANTSNQQYASLTFLVNTSASIQQPILTLAENGMVGINMQSPTHATLDVSGSIYASNGITGSLIGTSSWATNASTSSYISGSVIFSNGITASLFGSASFSLNVPATASFALSVVTASFASGYIKELTTGSTYQITSSWTNNAITASFVSTASFASTVVTASYANGYTRELTTGSTYQITSSWTNNSSTASYLSASQISCNILTASSGAQIGGTSTGVSATTITMIGYGQNGNNFNPNTVIIGSNAGQNATTASSTVIIGSNAGQNATTASSAVIIGNSAGSSATAAGTSVLIGSGAGSSATTATNAVMIGSNAGNTATTAGTSVLIGNSAGQSAVTASNAVIIGTIAGQSATNAGSAVFIGQSAGQNATSAANATIIGSNAGKSATTATTATLIGNAAGQTAVTASSATLIGTGAGSNATNATSATMIGSNAGNTATSAASCVLIGTSAGQSATTASNAVIIGSSAGLSATNATTTVLIGNTAGQNATTVNNSVIVGSAAGKNSNLATTAVLVGSSAGLNSTTASNCTYIGANADAVSGSNHQESIALGFNAKVSGSNQCAIGGTGADAVKVAIGATSAVNTLDVVGNISCSVITASLFNGTSSWATNAITSSTGASAWGNMTYTGTGGVTGSFYNATVTRQSVGLFGVVFTNNLGGSNYAVVMNGITGSSTLLPPTSSVIEAVNYKNTGFSMSIAKNSAQNIAADFNTASFIVHSY